MLIAFDGIPSTSAWRKAVLIAGFLVVSASGAHAQDLEPRAYANTPVGMNFLVAGYGFSEGGVATDPSLPLTNAQVYVNSANLAYAHVLDVGGRSGKLDLVLPYAWLSGRAEFAGQPQERNVSGFGDPKLRFSVNFYGAPALSLKEFSGYSQNIILGASLQVSAPLGQYASDKLVNIGTNRWFFKPELGLSKAWGPLILELVSGVTLYTDNHDFLGGMTRKQDPIYSLQGHIIYALKSGIWVALDGTYYTGGRTTVDGIRGDDLQNNSRFGSTIALPVNRYNSVKFYASTGVSTRTGSDFNAVGIAWQYRWGGGL
jgi:Putative MetA-pathway of phenol degradation